ncbi:hypothetical protein KC19_9G168700 [Ceratodon purpureus]|uniref:histidine kinase n=1 Tax=Ceratodon purpureus TaxID=3225 RepID=A0A8T0GWG4_CERPU|nr:hypothetical protein KC19_9G168700 [Ceratodon purpureus]
MAIAPDVSGRSQPPDMEDYQQRSMWPSTKQALMKTDQRRQRVQPAIGADLDQLLARDNTFADEQTFEELVRFSKIAITHQESLARLWKNKQANAVGLLREQLDSLQQRRIESERKKKEILDEHAAEIFHSYPDGDEEMLDPVSIGEGFICNSEPASSWSSVPDSASSLSEYEENNSTEYWREKAKALDSLLSESLKREDSLNGQLRESIAELPSRLSGELHEQFKRFDNFLRFTLRKAPVVFGHQDTELRYRFIHNAFPTLTEEEVIGKTDEEIYQGMGVPELMEFKRQVIRTKVPDKQEIKFHTNMFGSKTFMIAVDPVLDTNDVCVGLNYVAMDVTLQVAKREKLAKVQEEEAVTSAMESELNKTIYITEETMRAKQMLATMSHEIRSPLSGVISMASILARTPLNEDQKLKVDFMIKSGNDVLELINDILDLSKVEAGAMTFEAKKFRPREVVKHVVQMASTSVAAENKTLQVDADVSEDVPLEVIGDVLRIRQVLTNLVSNSVKFTHKGKVSIVVRVVGPPSFKNRDYMKPKQSSGCECGDTSQQQMERSALHVPMTVSSSLEVTPHIFHNNELTEPLLTPVNNNGVMFPESNLRTVSRDERLLSSVKSSNICQRDDISGDVTTALDKQRSEEQNSASSFSSRNAVEREALASTDGQFKDIMWIEFQIVDTGIGISESAISTLFKRYSQASSTHARKYGGTGLGLHICKQLVELMGGSITVLSKVKDGSVFSFKLPLRKQDPSSPISNDETEFLRDGDQEDVTYTDAPGSLQFNSDVTSPKNASHPVPKPQNRRRKVNYMSLRPEFHTPSGTRFDRYNPATEFLSQTRTTMEPVSTVDVKLLQNEECFPRPNSSAHLNTQGASLHAAAFQYAKAGFDKDDPVKSHHRSNTSLAHRLHGGRVRKCVQQNIRSSPGQGNIKKMEKTQNSERRAAPELLPAAKIVKYSRPFRILVAEDDPVNVKVATQMMIALGHELKVVNNGADAVQAVQQGTYDVVLMDVHMPVMGGLEATQHIRKYEETINDTGRTQQGATAAINGSHDTSLRRKKRRIPIIAMTADALTDNIEECAKHGMDNFIAKPVNLEKLEELLIQYVPSLDYDSI